MIIDYKLRFILVRKLRNFIFCYVYFIYDFYKYFLLICVFYLKIKLRSLSFKLEINFISCNCVLIRLF